jgi:hypothetical protein
MITPFEKILDRVHDALVDEWKGSWKLWSVQINALGLAMMAFGEMLRGYWFQIPDWLLNRIPHAETIGVILFALGLVARLLKQKKKSPDADANDTNG